MPGVCLGPMQITYPFLANRIRQLCLLGRFVECVGFPGLEGKPDKFSEIVFINPLPSSYRLTLCLSLYLSLCLSHRLSVGLSLCLSRYLPHKRSLRHLHIFCAFPDVQEGLGDGDTLWEEGRSGYRYFISLCLA